MPNNSIEYFFRFLRKMAYYLCPCCANKNSLYYLKRNVQFEPAPEPEDIIFENLEVKTFSRTMRTIIIHIISIIIICFSLGIIFALNKLQEKVDKKNENNHLIYLYLISFLISVIVDVIDFSLEEILKYLTKKERQLSMTDYYLSNSVKLTIYSFLNDAIMPLISEFLNKSDGYKILISNMLMIFLEKSFVTPIRWTINLDFLMKRFKIFLLERNVIRNNEGEIGLTQKELNDLYELPEMDIDQKYSHIFKMLLMSFFYIPIFPLGLIISFFGFLFVYWLEKFNFANIYQKPEMLNRHIAEFYVCYFIVVFFAYGVGDYIFIKDVYDSKKWSLVNIIVFGVLIIIPYHRILSKEYFDVEESEMNNKKYNDAYLSFRIDYERANPMTQKEGTINYLTKLRNENRIDEKTYIKQIEDINSANLIDLYYKQRVNNFNPTFTGFENGGFYGGFNYWGNMGPDDGFMNQGNVHIYNNNPYLNYEPNPNNYNEDGYDTHDPI